MFNDECNHRWVWEVDPAEGVAGSAVPRNGPGQGPLESSWSLLSYFRFYNYFYNLYVFIIFILNYFTLCYVIKIFVLNILF